MEPGLCKTREDDKGAQGALGKSIGLANRPPWKHFREEAVPLEGTLNVKLMLVNEPSQ